LRTNEPLYVSLTRFSSLFNDTVSFHSFSFPWTFIFPNSLFVLFLTITVSRAFGNARDFHGTHLLSLERKTSILFLRYRLQAHRIFFLTDLSWPPLSSATQYDIKKMCSVCLLGRELLNNLPLSFGFGYVAVCTGTLLSCS